MEIADKYSIDYRQLANGLHSFDFKVDGDLFKINESNEVKDGSCDVHANIEKSDSMIVLDVVISGSVVVECDRCLEDCNVPINYNGSLIVRFSDEVRDYDGEQMWISFGETLSLAQYIYESIIISLPYRRVHPDGECNSDMMSRFTPAADAE